MFQREKYFFFFYFYISSLFRSIPESNYYYVAEYAATEFKPFRCDRRIKYIEFSNSLHNGK